MQSLLDRAQSGTPIIEDVKATFVWRGESAPELIGDFSDWELGRRLALTEVAPEVWSHTLTLPRDAYIEYAFWQDGERVADPLNPNTTPNGLGNQNHYFYMPDGAPTPLTRRRRSVPHGTLTRHLLQVEFVIAGHRRQVHLYQPPTSEPAPLLVVLDGQDYHRRARLANIVDNLIAQDRMRPIALAMPYHGGPARGVEYACCELTLTFLLEQVVPLAQQELNLLDIEARPGSYGILGASMGGLMALHAGLRAPHVFGHVLSQSGAFCFGQRDPVVWDLVQHGPLQPIRIWMDVGRYEWLLECNQGMGDLLAAKGYTVIYREYSGGHNYPAWRNDLPRGLEALFSP